VIVIRIAIVMMIIMNNFDFRMFKGMMDEEMKKRKYNKEFPEMAENLIDQSQLTGKVSDQKELIVEIYGLLDKKDQEISELTKSVKQLEEAAGRIMESFQIQLDAVKEEVKRVGCGHMEKEKVAVPKVTEHHPTTTLKEPMKKMEDPWKIVSAKKTDKRPTNQHRLSRMHYRRYLKNIRIQ
jgi:hypothetical protein